LLNRSSHRNPRPGAADSHEPPLEESFS